MKWISILDEEPTAGQGVLVSLSNGFISVGYRALKKNSHDWQLFAPLDILDANDDEYVTHWMPLPEPPTFKRNKYNKSELRELYKYPSHYRKKK